MSALVAFIHHLAAFALVAALVLQKVHLRDVAAGAVDAKSVQNLARADRVYGAAAGILLVAGLLRVFVFEKGTGYYFHSVPFIVKFSLFVLVGLLSITPTIEYIRWGKALKAGQPVTVDAAKLASLRMIINIENAGVVAILLCAAMMAKGIGVFG